MKICCIVVLVLSIAVPASAQDPSFAKATEGKPPSSSPRKLIISEHAVAAALAKHPPAPPARQRDSVANGALIGGLLVGVALAGVGTYLCHALKEEGDPSCWGGVARVGAIGFGAGALVGAGLDALFTRSAAESFRGWPQTTRSIWGQPPDNTRR